MSELEEAYRQAPKIKSPSRVDARVTQAAENKVVRMKAKSRGDSIIPGLGAAFVSLCLVGIGVSVFMRSTSEVDRASITSADTVSVESLQEADQLSTGVASRQVAQLPDASVSANDSSIENSQASVATSATASAAASVATSADTTMQEQSRASEAVANNGSARYKSAAVDDAIDESVASNATDVASARSDFARTDSAGSNSARSNLVRKKTGVGKLSVEPSRELASVATSDSLMVTSDGRAWLSLQPVDSMVIEVTTTGSEKAALDLASLLPFKTQRIRVSENQWKLLHNASFTERENAEAALVELIEQVEDHVPVTSVTPSMMLHIVELEALLQSIK